MLIFSDEGTTPRAHLQLGMEHMMSSRLEMNRHEDSQAWEAPPQEGGTDSDKTLWMCFLPKYGCLPCRHDCTWPKRGTGLWGTPGPRAVSGRGHLGASSTGNPRGAPVTAQEPKPTPKPASRGWQKLPTPPQPREEQGPDLPVGLRSSFPRGRTAPRRHGEIR